MNQRGFSFLLVPIISILVLIVGGAIYFSFKQPFSLIYKLPISPNPKTSSVPIVSQTTTLNSYQGYTDQNRSFTFQIPLNWKVVKNEDGSLSVQDNYQSPAITQFNSVKIKDKDVIYCESNLNDYRCETFTSVSGLVVINWGKFTSPVAKENGIAEVIGKNEIVEFQIGDVTDQDRGPIRKILASFRFLDQSLRPSVSCLPRPACLNTTPRCMIAEPASGWCK